MYMAYLEYGYEWPQEVAIFDTLIQSRDYLFSLDILRYSSGHFCQIPKIVELPKNGRVDFNLAFQAFTVEEYVKDVTCII